MEGYSDCQKNIAGSIALKCDLKMDRYNIRKPGSNTVIRLTFKRESATQRSGNQVTKSELRFSDS